MIYVTEFKNEVCRLCAFWWNNSLNVTSIFDVKWWVVIVVAIMTIKVIILLKEVVRVRACVDGFPIL
jgi:hypothetical protein